MVRPQPTSDEKRPGRGRQRINPREFATTGPRTPETAANYLLHRGLRQDGSGDQRGVSKDRRFDAVERLIEIAPEGDSAKEGGHLAVWGLGTAAIPDSLETHLVGHVPTVARLDVVERPCDDDPPQFSKLGGQLSFEPGA